MEYNQNFLNFEIPTQISMRKTFLKSEQKEYSALLNLHTHTNTWNVMQAPYVILKLF